MINRLLIVTFLLFPVAAWSQLDANHAGARAASMGGCYVASMDSSVCVDVGWRQSFAMRGMATRTIALGAPLGARGRALLLYSGFGDVDYHEQQVSAGYLLAVAPWLNIMVYGLYSGIGTSDAQYWGGQIWLDAGGGITLGGDRVWGYAVAGSRSWSDTRAWMLRGGMAYRHTEHVISAVGFSIEERLRLRCGMEYSYNRCAFVRAGLCSNPLTLTFGVGYRQRHYHIDLATEVHSFLGLSPQISLGLCL